MSLQRWKKLGRLFDPQGRVARFSSHAALPVMHKKDENLLRVYFSGRDQHNRAEIGFFDLDPRNTPSVKRLSSSPVILRGDLGTFDDSGATSATLVQCDGRLFQFYTGWNLGVTVPFYYGIGLAISDDGGESFRKVSTAPILGRNSTDPLLCASPSVLLENNLWRMWYVSGVRWTIENGQPKHYYHIRYAESHNGLEWRPTGKVCIDFKSPDEHAIGRPCVLHEDDRYRMWYCYRGSKYRIGYAESLDGLEWQRMDENLDLGTSAEGWDSEELAYPFLSRLNGQLWML